jgi:leucyl aminopeptidase
MHIEVVTPDTLPEGLVALGIPAYSSDDGPRIATDSPALVAAGAPETLDPAWCKRHGFTGKVGQTLTVRAGMPPAGSGDAGGAPASAPDVVVVGVGDAAALAGTVGLESLRRASAAFVRAVGRGSAAALVLPQGAGLPLDGAASAVAEGAVLAAYRYDDYRTGEEAERLVSLAIIPPAGSDSGPAATGAAAGARLAESVSLARDLVNEPPSALTPAIFADTFVRRFADVDEVTIEVWDEERIVEERLGGLLGVARGSTQPPRLVRVEYVPRDPIEIDGRVPHLALVGKGITFDSGGLSLKTAGGMETMKTDMGGAAAVLGAVDAAAALGARIRITALTPLTENMPGGSAIKPGDVLTTRKGKTIEVLNTDAEGRLVLSDGLTLAAESEPDAIIDLATLTGAAVVALGKEIAGLFGNDDVLIGEVHAAGERAGEPNWALPLPDDYRGHIDSEVADMRNVGRPGQAGSIAAAMLLREFVGSVPWAHLDIAGPARSDESSRYLTKGGTGFGVRTLVALITSEEFARTLVTLGSD